MTYGRISRKRGSKVAQSIAEARALRVRIGAEQDKPGEITSTVLKGEINRFSVSTVCDKRELFWPRRLFNFRIREILRIVWRYYFAPAPE
jgi:hypothetical protein